jgi:LPXTG-motif cell wall-anchored protein
MEMNTRLKTLLLSSSLTLSFFMTTPAMADESNKRTEFEFSAPVEIPGHVLAPGKYVFELLDTASSDRNIVQIFSKDSNGNETLIATISAIPDYTANTPEKAAVHFEERHAGTPEAIHSWFYPGDDTGWEFVYPKGQTLEANAKATPDSAPVAAAAAPSMPPAQPATHVQQVQENEPAPQVRLVEERILLAQNEAPAQLPVQGTEIQTSAAQVLPQTGGNSDPELLTAFTMLGSGIAAILAFRRKSWLRARG